MNRIAMSAAAAALLRVLIGRAGVARNRILLSAAHSVDWQSLTFAGERHVIELRVAGPDSGVIVERMCAGLEDAEFSIPGVLVADIGTIAKPILGPDGSARVTVEALTIAAD